MASSPNPPALSTTVSSPQPQTTLEPAGGPFIRHAFQGRRQAYDLTGNAFSAQINQPLIAQPGYAKNLRVRINATGGTSTGTTTATADAPYSVVSNVALYDATGVPIINGPGYAMLYLVPLFSGGFGLPGTNTCDIGNLPSYIPVATGASAGGNFTFNTCIPLEFVTGYGVLGMANASVLPNIQWQLSASTAVYTSGPATNPTVEVRVGHDMYWLPQGVNIAPPGLGSSRQWMFTIGNPTAASGAYADITAPRPGGYLDTIILICRDANGLRQDGWPNRCRLWVDGVPLIDSFIDEIYDDMAIKFGVGPFAGANSGASSAVGTISVRRPTGVIAFTFKDSLSQEVLGLADTLEKVLSSNPGTSIQFGGTWGTAGTPPYTLDFIFGQIVPSAALIQGLPEV